MTHQATPHVLNRIVVAVDFSDPSIAAATWVAQYFARETELVLVHVIEPPPPSRFLEKRYPSNDRIVETARVGAEARLRALSAPIATSLIWPEIRVGIPDEEIVHVAADYEADLIVVGRTHPHAGGWGYVGTTAQRVLRRSTVPTLLVTEKAPKAPSRMLVALDDSATSGRVLEWADFLGARLSADATVMHVLSVPVFVGDAGGLTAADETDPHDATEDTRARAQAEKWLEERLAKSTRRARLTPLVVTGSVLPADAILEETARGQVGLIVMGSRGAGGANRLLFGSVAERVLRDAPCPVFVVGPHAAKPGKRRRNLSRDSGVSQPIPESSRMQPRR